MKLSSDKKNAFIHMHKAMSLLDGGAAAQAMIYSLARGLRVGEVDSEDVADIISALFDEEAVNAIDQMTDEMASGMSIKDILELL